MSAEIHDIEFFYAFYCVGIFLPGFEEIEPRAASGRKATNENRQDVFVIGARQKELCAAELFFEKLR